MNAHPLLLVEQVAQTVVVRIIKGTLTRRVHDNEIRISEMSKGFGQTVATARRSHVSSHRATQ